MQALQIRFTQGPMQGTTKQYDLGYLLIGREPRPEVDQQALILTGADGSVSRNHVALFDRDGQVILQNISGNGTRVDGTLIIEEAVLKPGAQITIGSHHQLEVKWQLVGRQKQEDKDAKAPAATKAASSGLLASPVVRALLAVYLVAIIGVAAYLSWQGGRNASIPDDWPQLSAAYEAYQPTEISAAEKTRRANLAEALLVRLRVLRANERTYEVKRLCRVLMRLDADIQSPIYRYGATCLGSIN
jgi:pSer/pThr/pTyr-binding forkhead associated (FHA) protein